MATPRTEPNEFVLADYTFRVFGDHEKWYDLEKGPDGEELTEDVWADIRKELEMGFDAVCNNMAEKWKEWHLRFDYGD